MKKIIAVLLTLAACTQAKKELQSSTQASADNKRTEVQQQEGWKLLFDGQTLTGWKIYKEWKNNTWEVKDGTLHCRPVNEQVKGDGDERSDLMTTEQFANFEFTCNWKISPEGNSGIIYRVTEEFEQPYFSGPEYQLIDDEGYKPKQNDVHLTGANYDMMPPTAKVVKPVGEWNFTKIVANGNHVEHWLNGQKIVEYELRSPDWQKRKDESKWKDKKGYGMASQGHIDLQDHGSEVWFKNVMIKAL